MKKKNIYVVYGRTGEYSDYAEWNVAAYATEASAEKHAERANARAQALYNNYMIDTQQATEWMGDLDPDLYRFDRYLEYGVCVVPVLSRVPEAKEEK